MPDASGEVVIVTGVGKDTGLGFAMCGKLAARGFTVILTARNAAAAMTLGQRLAETTPGRVFGRSLDVADPHSIEALKSFTESTFGRLDVLINNAAGLSPYGERAGGADLSLAREVIDTTLLGSWRMCQAFLPLLRNSPSGRIVNVSSGAGSHGDPGFGLTTGNQMGTSYAVAKAALNALTVKLALEESTPALRINAVCPGFTATFPGGEAMGARPVSQGADSILWAAFIGNDGPTGGFFRDGKPLPW